MVGRRFVPVFKGWQDVFMWGITVSLSIILKKGALTKMVLSTADCISFQTFKEQKNPWRAVCYHCGLQLKIAEIVNSEVILEA